MATNPIRVPEDVHNEVLTAARVIGCNASELLERAWNLYRHTPEFVADFELAQKAFSVGDLNAIASRLNEQAADRARQRAASVAALRNG
jgi:hypothetical protein